MLSLKQIEHFVKALNLHSYPLYKQKMQCLQYDDDDYDIDEYDDNHQNFLELSQYQYLFSQKVHPKHNLDHHGDHMNDFLKSLKS